MIRVLVVDDHPIVHNGLRQIFAKAPDIVIADEVRSGEEALKKLRNGRYDVLILDIVLPGLGGLEVLRQVKTEGIKTAVLMLSMYPEEHYAVRTLELGAAGYLSKENVPDEVIGAVRKVARGETYVSASVAESMSGSGGRRRRPPHETLSPREYQVMCMIASGKTVGAIARALSLSVKTIDTHRAHILGKLGLRNNVDIARYALAHRLAF